jgi:hypothetical protein
VEKGEGDCVKGMFECKRNVREEVDAQCVGILVTPRSAIRLNGYKDALISGRHYGASAPFGGQLVLHVNTRPMDIYFPFLHYDPDLLFNLLSPIPIPLSDCV